MNEGARFELIYSAKRDGWDASDFHKKCDGQGPTVTLFKSAEGHRFGGFTSVAWNGSEEEDWVEDPSSVIFSIDERELVLKPSSATVIHHENWGPNFGGSDLGIYCRKSQKMNSSN